MFVFVIYMKFSQFDARSCAFLHFSECMHVAHTHTHSYDVRVFCVNKISLVSLNHEKVKLNESKSNEESEKELKRSANELEWSGKNSEITIKLSYVYEYCPLGFMDIELSVFLVASIIKIFHRDLSF